jgi:hypothetical protein
MNQDRIDRIVEELEQYLPTSAQALLQELIEGLKKVPPTPNNKLINQIKKGEYIGPYSWDTTGRYSDKIKKYQIKNKKVDDEYHRYA